MTLGAVGKAWEEMSASFDRFCLAGIAALGTMLEKDAEHDHPERHLNGYAGILDALGGLQPVGELIADGEM